VVYDIPSIVPGRPWSPNTTKTRYLIAHPILRYCLWVEFPDIAGLLQSKGITQPPYTLPAIEDPNTGTFVVDSLAIATHLDETYPEMPKVLSPAARALLEKIQWRCVLVWLRRWGTSKCEHESQARVTCSSYWLPSASTLSARHTITVSPNT
ncbi:hypothetical protein EV363DRAFT_1161954, partial [Boletus edulis]